MLSSIPDLSKHTGQSIFGRAYRVMLERDSHAPSSVDRRLTEDMVRLCPVTADYLYSRFTPTMVRYTLTSRPALEQAVAGAVDPCLEPEEKVRVLARFCARLGAKVDHAAPICLGGTEEQILERGSDWCTDVARVGCALYQVAGLPSRLAYLLDTRQAYCSHVIVEVFRRGAWGAVDTSTGVVYCWPAGKAASVWELMREPGIIEQHHAPAAVYTTPEQFREAAIANYFIDESGRYDYSTSNLNDYYRSILRMAGRGWPGGLRWLHGEADGR